MKLHNYQHFHYYYFTENNTNKIYHHIYLTKRIAYNDNNKKNHYIHRIDHCYYLPKGYFAIKKKGRLAHFTYYHDWSDKQFIQQNEGTHTHNNIKKKYQVTNYPDNLTLGKYTSKIQAWFRNLNNSNLYFKFNEDDEENNYRSSDTRIFKVYLFIRVWTFYLGLTCPYFKKKNGERYISLFPM